MAQNKNLQSDFDIMFTSHDIVTSIVDKLLFDCQYF